MSLTLAALSVAACDSLLDVADNPDTIAAEGIEGPGSFPARLVGTESDFVSAFDNAVVFQGLFADELVWGGSFIARAEVDRRDIATTNDIIAGGVYTQLQTAAKTSKDLQREMLDNKFPVQVPDPTNAAELARVSLFSGYSRLYLGEMFCTLAFDGVGPELQSSDVFQMAIDDFTLAISAGNAAPDVVDAALVGRARAKLMLGDDAGAAVDAGQVPAGFAFIAPYSNNSGREQNGIFGLTNAGARLSVDPLFRGLTIDAGATPDPRVVVVDNGEPTFNGEVESWSPAKYVSVSAPIRLASWEEAQYIVAEAQGGASARDIINQVRAAQGIVEVFDAGGTASDTEIRDKLIDERSRELFMEGHRMGDLRRYLSGFGLDLFPTGPLFGTQTCMPLPDLERDNNSGL